MRAYTASATSGVGDPVSMEAMTVHLPVPFWPAASRIESSTSSPSSRNPRMSAVISMRYEASFSSFHSANAACMAAASMARPALIRW